ncbi:hypothetical protein KKB18_09025, partial [bacterium]|nr:hypothetical protein [bacterium]
HYFSNSLWKNFKDHYKRSRMWMDIFMRERRFDNYVTTRPHGAGKASGFLAIILLPLGLIFPYFGIVSLLFFSLFFYLNRKFFYLAFKENGFIFFLSTILYDLAFSIAVSLGIGIEILNQIIRYVKGLFVKNLT